MNIYSSKDYEATIAQKDARIKELEAKLEGISRACNNAFNKSLGMKADNAVMTLTGTVVSIVQIAIDAAIQGSKP
ncbi:MAG: hypothetical protein NVS3B3_18620 [Aquirhabdus sp.]